MEAALSSCLTKVATTWLTVLAAVAIWTSLLAPVPSLSKQPPVLLAPTNQKQKDACDLLIQGAQFLKAKKPFQARPLIEKAAMLWPESPHIHYNLGCCYMEIGEFPKAIAEFQYTLQVEPKLSDCIANIASCYQLMGRPRDAIVWFQGYLHQHPRAPDADQVQGMIGALERQASKQIESDPQDTDYLPSISPQGRMQRWQMDRLPIKVFISNGKDEEGNDVRGFHENYNMLLLEAFNTWVRASNNHLSYTLVTEATQADIVCTWTDKNDFLKEQGNKVEQGVARVSARPLPGKNEDEIGRVRVIILVLDQDGKKNISDEEMKKACLHEIGHALGFGGHSTNNKDIMFFSDSPTVWASLTKRDKATMARLYADYPETAPNSAMSQFHGAP